MLAESNSWINKQTFIYANNKKTSFVLLNEYSKTFFAKSLAFILDKTFKFSKLYSITRQNSTILVQFFDTSVLLLAIWVSFKIMQPIIFMIIIPMVAKMISIWDRKVFFVCTFHNIFILDTTLYLWLHRYQWKKVSKNPRERGSIYIPAAVNL